MFQKPKRFSLTGPLHVDDYKTYLENSKQEFYNLWDLKWVEDSQMSDFIPKKKLGKGAFGIVYLVEHKKDGKLYASKEINTISIKEKTQKEHLKNEFKILKCLNFPLTIHLEHFFRHDSNLCFIVPYISGNQLFELLGKRVKLNEHEVKFIGSQVVLCIEYLHNLDVIYRDLKPENILIDPTGYLKIVDFGFSKILKDRTYSLCGTPEYLAPEIVLNKGYGKSVDWWTVGILLFELVSGKTPFYDENALVMYEKAIAGEFDMPEYVSSQLQDLIKNIIQPDLTKRFGNLKDGIDDIKKHDWFSDIDWTLLFNRKVVSPFTSQADTLHDEVEFENF